MRILFLGCGGGRLNVLKQFYSTAGFVIDCSKKIYVDPGPGAAIQFRKFEKKFKLKITDIEGIYVSHAHLDHINDVEVVIEGMTDYATKKKGFLICDKSILGKTLIEQLSDTLNILNVLNILKFEQNKKDKEKTEKNPSDSEIEEIGEITPSISNYHKNLIEKIYTISPGKIVEIDNLTFKGTKTKHDSPATGFVLEDKFENIKLGYTSDTEFFEGIL
mgnify:CR=1 FL=1